MQLRQPGPLCMQRMYERWSDVALATSYSPRQSTELARHGWEPNAVVFCSNVSEAPSKFRSSSTNVPLAS